MLTEFHRMNTIYSSNAKVTQADAMAEPPEDGHDRPSLPWRIGSSLTMGMVGGICRSFLHGLSNIETFGLERFLERLEERRDVGARERGLLTGLRQSFSFCLSLTDWELYSREPCKRVRMCTLLLLKPPVCATGSMADSVVTTDSMILSSGASSHTDTRSALKTTGGAWEAMICASRTSTIHETEWQDDSELTASQSPINILHPRTSPPNAPLRILALRRPLPTDHDPSNPDPILTTILQIRPNRSARLQSLPPLQKSRHSRPLHLRRPNLQHQRHRHLPRPLLLPQPQFQLGTHIPRRQSPPTPR